MSEEKTEQPTQKRLREARERGEVCKSQDVASSLTVLALAGYMILGGEHVFTLMRDLTLLPMTLIARPFDEAAAQVVDAALQAFFLIVLPVLALVIVVGLAANMAQVGVLFSVEAAIPKLSNLSPTKWVHKVFSLKNLVELIKNVLKIVVLGAAVYNVLRGVLPDIFSIRAGNIGSLWSLMGSATGRLLLVCATCFCAIAAVDYLYQRWQFTKEHMMSKDEVRREYKEMEGDPRIKSKRKQLHQELIAQGATHSVRRAKVLITNPTHFAIALDYEKDRTPLPVILAKGEGEVARRMIAEAREAGIPVMRNVPLAHDLFEQGTENAYIPKELIGPVAEVLRWVQSLEKHA